MVSTDTLQARVGKYLYREAAYPPNWVAVDDLVAAIAPVAERGSAESAIEQAALDRLSPVEYVSHTGRSAVTLERGSRGQVNARLKDWIERHDPDELPSGLK